METLVNGARELLGIELKTDQIAALGCYARELIIWNERVNLTAIRDPEMILIKHFLDSLSCLLGMRGTPMARVVDVGSGAGFPGLPLKIICPHMHMTLVESIGKKVEFCQHVVKLLGLDQVEILQERAERVGQMPEHREQYDWALARAVAIMPVLMEYLMPLARIGGQALAQKGESGPVETQRAERSIRLLGGHLRQIIPINLPAVAEQRYLILIDKVAATPEKYPRRVGVPSKRPLV